MIDLIAERKRRGAAMVAIHDYSVRKRIADIVVDMTRFTAAA